MPESLDRDAVERVLRRAVELSADEDAESGIDGDALVEAGAEVGIPEGVMQQSLAIERLGPEPESSSLDRVVGPHVVSAERTIDVAPDVALDRLAGWLETRHYLRQERSQPGEMTWSKRKGFAASALRSTRSVTGEGRLGDVQMLRAQAVDVDGTCCVVRVSIDRSRNRRTKLVAGSVLGAGSVVALSGVLVTPPLGLVAVPVALAGVGVSRSGGRNARSLQAELLRVLDAVEDGRGPRFRSRRQRSNRRGSR